MIKYATQGLAQICKNIQESTGLNASWGVSGELTEGEGFNYSDLEWYSEDISKPTEADIIEASAQYQAEYDNAQYSRDRAEAYPSIEDQLDKIYHDGIDAWKADIKAVKDEYPKP